MAANRCIAAAESALHDIRVEFVAGEPEAMTEAANAKLEAEGDLGKYRLSCQCFVKDEMHVKGL